MPRWNHDKVLHALELQPEPISSLIAAFPGEAAAAVDPHWIDEWFHTQAAARFAGKPAPEFEITASKATKAVLDPLAKKRAKSAVRLLSVDPNYFRGFRASVGPISLRESLVVVEGLNSSGKTSTSEALEWLITGRLSRRESGHPKELANCIANEFRPAKQTTWVECVFEIDGTAKALKRVLIEDYTTAATSAASSTLYRDGVELTADEEGELVEQMFSGVHPILMQHTLREFVYSTPSERRRYFERLLEIDQLTALIERAVIGDSKLRDFKSPSPTATRQYLEQLSAAVHDSSVRKKAKDLGRAADKREALSDLLIAAASFEFGIKGDIATAREELELQQGLTRERQFPQLASLKASQQVRTLDTSGVLIAAEALVSAAERRDLAVAAAESLEKADRLLAQSLEALISLGVLADQPVDSQLCPLCRDERLTLSPKRQSVIRAVAPAALALEQAESHLRAATQRWKAEQEALARQIASCAPPGVEDGKRALQEIDTGLHAAASAAIRSTAALKEAARACVAKIEASHPAASSSLDQYKTGVTDAVAQLQLPASEHAVALAELERELGAGAAADPKYANREAWLELAKNEKATLNQLEWDDALKEAQNQLGEIRKGLIDLRASIIEGARQAFTNEMASVWRELREDAGGKFSKLSIPPVHGKGYKLEFEVKAILSDGHAEVEVDALRVFSESQVNVVGIAAYVTRAAALGHTVLVFDDPVQSMDEEHFKSLASRLIPNLLDRGCQIIVFTHSDSFARDLSHANYSRESYATLRTRYSKRNGCCVDEGSRRVAERLKIAERLTEEGHLSDAWNRIRLAVERLYTIAMRATDPTFDPDRWRNLSAEAMWNAGAGDVITKAIDGSAPRLKQILEQSAKGAHDSAATSATEIVAAIKYLKSCLAPLRVGAG
jgi:hypothetical protein